MANTLPVFYPVSGQDAYDYLRIPAMAVHWCRQDDVVLVAGGGGTKGTGIRSGITVCKVKKGDIHPIGFLDTHDKLVVAIASHPNKPFYACAIGEFTYILELRQDSSLHVVERAKADYSETDPFQSCVAFSPSGAIIATGGLDQVVRTFKYPSLGSLIQFQYHKSPIQSISFNSSSSLMVTTSREPFCIVWHVDHSKMWALSYRNMEFRGCTFSRHYENIIFAWLNERSSGSVLTKWDVITGTVLALKQLDMKPVTAARLSPDGSVIAVTTLHKDCTVYSLDTQTLSLVGKRHVPHDFPQTSMEFSPIGDRIVSVSADMSHKIFPSRSPSWVKRFVFVLFLIGGILSAVFALRLTE